MGTVVWFSACSLTACGVTVCVLSRLSRSVEVLAHFVKCLSVYPMTPCHIYLGLLFSLCTIIACNIVITSIYLAL